MRQFQRGGHIGLIANVLASKSFIPDFGSRLIKVVNLNLEERVS